LIQKIIVTSLQFPWQQILGGKNNYVSDRNAHCVERTIELDRMEMEEQKKRASKLSDNAKYRK
jgi:hypothetical protein